MDGFKRPLSRRPGTPLNTAPTGQPPAPAGQDVRGPQPPVEQPMSSPQNTAPTGGTQPVSTPPPPRKRRTGLIIFVVAVGLLILAVVGSVFWYDQQTQPLAASGQGKQQRIEVKEGDTWSTIGDKLAKNGIVRSSTAFEIAARLHGSSLQQGTCTVTSSQTPRELIAKFAKGCQDFKSITFYPGATIEKPLYKPEHAQLEQTMYIKNVLAKAGFSDDEISRALAKQYDSPLFAGKPAGASLEGYVYGETYFVDENATAEDVLNTTFAQMYKEIKENDLEAKFKAQGLNLFQGITLASIVQRELNCEGKPTPERQERCYQYQRTIAQIFLSRYKDGTVLGSDVTFIYAADMMGVTPRVDLDSPYNLRKNAGLTPGPISTPGIHALRAVGDPSPTDYRYFIAGDDGLIYFGRTEADHQANIKNHCQKLCSEL